MPDLDNLDPPEIFGPTGATRLIRNGFMQTNLDADFHQIINLDTSNLTFTGIDSQPPVANKWFNSFDAGTRTFGIAQPAFSNLSGFLTTAQQIAITQVGVVRIGTWIATELIPSKVPILNLIRKPEGNVDLNSKKITSLADAVDDQDAVNLRTLRQVSETNPKAAVVAATTQSVLTEGLQTIDGVALQDGDRVLVKDQQHAGFYPGEDGSRSYDNGIWNAHAGQWTRSTDFDGLPVTVPEGLEVVNATVFVLGGTENIGTKWLQTEPAPIQVGFDTILFSLLERGFTIDVGAGLDRTGNTIFAVGTANRITIGAGIDISAAYVGQASITTLGTIGTGVWHGTVIDGAYGGTGIANVDRNITLGVDLVIDKVGAAIPEDVLTFFVGGTTALTLPFAGTVATLAGNETFTNKHISASQIDSGVLAVARGGVPTQVLADAGKFLMADGAGGLTWETP